MFLWRGIRGLLSATILQNLANSYPAILTNTNLFAGTSTGSGIISQLLADNSLDYIINTYFLEKAVGYYGMGQIDPSLPMYSVSEVYAGQVALHPPVGFPPKLPTLSSFSQSVLFTAFNVGSYDESTGTGTPWTPLLFSNLPNSPNAGTTIAEAVTSSSVMPGMMGSYNGNIDGAFVHHDPTIAAIAMALSSNPSLTLNDINVICIGTGFMANWVASDTSQWGAQQWQNGDGNPNNNTPALLLNGTVSPVLNACLNGTSTSLIPQLAGMMLPPGQYAYLNPTLAYYIPENDIIPADLTYLQTQAANCDQQQVQIAENMLQNW